jgi:hypothetical protein
VYVGLSDEISDNDLKAAGKRLLLALAYSAIPDGRRFYSVAFLASHARLPFPRWVWQKPASGRHEAEQQNLGKLKCAYFAWKVEPFASGREQDTFFVCMYGVYLLHTSPSGQMNARAPDAMDICDAWYAQWEQVRAVCTSVCH